MLFSLVISFPLLFTIQEAFKRREKSLEYLSAFKAGLEISIQSFHQAKKLSTAKKTEIEQRLLLLSRDLMAFLRTGMPEPSALVEQIQEIFRFMQINKREISFPINMRAYRYLESVYESTTYLISLRRHGTMVVIRGMTYVFMYVFPFFQAPVLYYLFGDMAPHWVIYFFAILSSLLLMVLYTIQRQLENPFGQNGLDNVILEDFL